MAGPLFAMTSGGDGWEDERLAVTYDEARTVLDAQNATMSDIDSKAMRTVRFNVLLIGVLIAAARFAGSGLFHAGASSLAIGLFVLSTILGISTYNESNLYVGPSGPYLERLVAAQTDAERRDRSLLLSFAGTVSENADVIDWNSWLLTATQALLALGIAVGVLATLI